MPSHISHDDQIAHRIDPDRVEIFNVLGPTIQFLTSPDDAAAPCVMRGTIPPGVAVPMHSHADPETFMAISGMLDGLVCDGSDFKWVRINPGDIFHVPGNAKHGFRNPGRQPAVMMIVSTSKIGRFFQEVGTPAVQGAYNTPPSRQAIERFLRVSERYGYWNATPEENARVGLTLPGV